MPLLKTNNFSPIFLFRNKHFNTLYRYFTTKIQVNFQRQRISTLDGDFIDLDRASVQSKKCIIAIHGLEGSSNSSYIKSLTVMANKQGYDVIAFNLRGCSGVPNLNLGSYHSGKTSDLHEVIQYIENQYHYDSLYIVGYSLGGNLTLKYMGEYAPKISRHIKSAVAVSAPCDLKGSAQTLNKKSNRIYQSNFLKTLKAKAHYKLNQFPRSGLDAHRISQAKTFYEFDNYFTAPTQGFKDAEDYWEKSSSKKYIQHISLPSLLVSALDDPFLNKSCYPIQEAKVSSYFSLLTPKYGGHVGFYSSFKNDYWLEKTMLQFLTDSEILGS